MPKSHPPDLSLIIPAYRCQTIDTDLQRIANICENLKVSFEIICVVDGLADEQDLTFHLSKKNKIPQLKIFCYKQNRGKGFAIRFGFKKARGKVIGFIDAGNDIAAESIITAYHALVNHQADIVLGSKHHSMSTVASPWQRKLYSFVLKRMIHLMFGLKVTDTQAGLKLFSGSIIKPILPNLKINRWAFDLEILALLNQQNHLKILEVPIHLTYNYKSNINSWALLSFFYDFWRIFWRIKIR